MPQTQNRLGDPQNQKGNTFIPELKARGQLKTPISEDEIRIEPMVFSATPTFAYENGGPITAMFLDTIMGLWSSKVNRIGVSNTFTDEDWSIDTRVHMLMPGMYPAIPGWHLDAIRRPAGFENTPFYQPIWWDRPHEDTHYVCTVGDSAMTEYIQQPGLFTLNTPKKLGVYGDFNEQINAAGIKGQPPTVGYNEFQTEMARSGMIYEFGSSDIHRATPNLLDRPIWRFFFRASNAEFQQRNEIRNQVQVYTTEGGW